jgi:MoxR-like ATPase
MSIKNLNDTEAIKKLAEAVNSAKAEISKAIVGQQAAVDQLIISLFARGHCLLIGVPGLAKTLLIKTLAGALDLSYNRIQFTPDLMPGDITGGEVIETNVSTGEKQFRFIKGPIFANIVLADEINRTPPKTQSALLEAMEEKAVTAAGSTHILKAPFFVLATQNPIEQEGTYPLPEAQLDRFMFNIWLDYPSAIEEINIVKSTTADYKPKIEKVLNAEQIIEFQDLIRRVPVADNVTDYAVKLVRASRPTDASDAFVKEYIAYGAGPRASQYLILGAKTRAAINGKFTPDIDDVKAVAVSTLRHRIVANFSAEADGISPKEIVEKLLSVV